MVVAVALFAGACRGERGERRSTTSPAMRDASLAAAHVWTAPSIPTESIDFSLNTPGPGGFDASDDVECAFVSDLVGGTTPKFDCRTAGGDTLKVKYGATEPEIPAEAAATRLLSALGFAVDHVDLVHSVRCDGCPPLPMAAADCLKHRLPTAVCLLGSTPGHVRTFRHVMIERPVHGAKIEAAHEEGWGWFELDRVDAREGGATRAEIDAFRLMAVLLAHWDNKGGNQRLVCPPGAERPDGSCGAPVALIHDLGATFGPLKLDLENWRQVPVWADPSSCRVNMSRLPFGGATFGEARISEAGRQFALRLLRPLTRTQLDTLWESTGVTRFNHVLTEAHDPAAWTTAFLAKVDAIAAGGPCPDEGIAATAPR